MGVLAACEDSEDPNVGTTVEDVTDAGDEAEILGAREVYEDYNPYLGQTVTVSGEISDLYGPNAFKIGEELWGEELLVLVPEGTGISGTNVAGDEVSVFDDLDREYVVQVTGRVQQYVPVDIEEEFSLDLDTDLEAEMEEEEPMIVAESVEVMPEEAVEED